MHLSLKSQVLYRRNLFSRYFRLFCRATICHKTCRMWRIVVFSDWDYQLKLKSRSFGWERLISRNRTRPEHKILSTVVDNSSKTHRIRSKHDSFDCIRFTLQVQAKNTHLSLTSQILHRKILFCRYSRLLYRAKLTIFHNTRRICWIVVFSDWDHQL